MLVLAATLTLSLEANGGALQRDVATCLRGSVPGPGCAGRVEFDARGSVSPKRLPTQELAPVALSVHGKIRTENGGHPPALRKAFVSVDADVTIDAAGLPACSLLRLRRLDAVGARQACRRAIVGTGVARIGFASTEGTVKAPLTFFNGGTSDGITRLFVHSAIATLDPTLVVAVAKIRLRGSGLETTWWIPPALEGDGSLVDFRAEIGRRFMARGEPRSYISARCPDERFQVSVPKLLFRNEAHSQGEPAQSVLRGSLAIPCATEPARR